MAIGFDTIESLSVSQFEKLKNNGNSFFIARIYQSNGKIDEKGIKNIVNAKAAGFTDIDAYIFPCVSPTTASPASTQIIDTYNALKSQNIAIANIGRLWLDIETTQSWFQQTQSINRQFILDMANTATEKLGFQIGIYSNSNNWSSIVGNSWNEPSKKYPLWWAKYNNTPDLTKGWSSFGGWSQPFMHQYIGDTYELGHRIDKNFK